MFSLHSVSKFFIIIAATVTALFFSGFSEDKPYQNTPTTLNTYANEFNEALMALDKAAEDYKFGRISIDTLREKLKDTRLRYKKIEFYIAFHYPEYVKEHINGAPLLHLEKEDSRPKVIEPEGLQVLDELIFAENADEENNSIADMAKRLKNYYDPLHKDILKRGKIASMEITALRMQLVRIFTMGVTGFDTPGSLQALDEAHASFVGMKVYFEENYTTNDPVKANVLKLFEEGITELEKPLDFETFDRLAFLKKYIDPLYSALGKIRSNDNVEMMQNTTAWNPAGSSLFADDFLNPYFFSELKEDEDSPELRALGQSLFFNPVISNDGKISCASCHQPGRAFTDALPKSLSNIQGKTVLRNAPTLINAVYADRFFYDLRAFTLEQQAEHVIFNPDEFNTAYDTILKKLNADAKYKEEFEKLFGRDGITRENFSKALASYVLSLRSFNSEFDKYVRGEIQDMPQDVKNGFNLFMGKANCATCHFAPTFSGLVPPFYTENESEILGVLTTPDTLEGKSDTDEGRYGNRIFNEYAWIYEKSFKTTTVRNAGLTAPYFHNGAYTTLEEVIDFYNEGGGEGMGHPVTNQTLPADKLQLTDKEKKELIAFINSLNDVPENK